jgi:hypothetical protein
MQGYDVQQGSTAYPLAFLMVLASDHITGAIGLSPTVTIRKVGGSLATPAGTITEIGKGWYQVAGNATDTSTLGPIVLHAEAATADPSDALFPCVLYNPQSASLGLILAKGTNITGFNDIAVTAVVSGGAITTASGKVSGVALVDTLTTYTGNTVQTGDAFGRIGVAGASLTALGDTRIANLDAAVSSRSVYAGGAVASVTGSVGSIAGVTFPANFSTFAIDVSGRVDLGKILGTASAGVAGYVGPDWSHVNAPTSTVGLSGTTVGSLTNAPTAGDLTATMKASITTAATAATPTAAAVTGAVGSVAGSVGSVTGGVTVTANNDKTGYSLNLTQAIPTTNTAQTVGDALNAARADGFGKWVLVGTTLTLYAGDGTTAVRVFTLDSGTAPTSRT